MEKNIIIVSSNQTAFKAWLNVACSLALFVGLIGLGVVLDSSAMQWAGFFSSVLILWGKSSSMMKERTFTIDAARAELERIASDIEESK